MIFHAISLFRKTLLKTSFITYVRNLNAYSWLFNYHDALNWNSISDCFYQKPVPTQNSIAAAPQNCPPQTKLKPDLIENIGNFFDSTIIQVTTCFPSDMSIIFHLILFSVFKTHNSLKQSSTYCSTIKDWIKKYIENFCWILLEKDTIFSWIIVCEWEWSEPIYTPWGTGAKQILWALQGTQWILKVSSLS